MTRKRLKLKINGRPCEVEVARSTLLLDLLRDELGLTGAKRGCETGYCGCCTVLLNGKAVHSCCVLALRAEGREVVTIEGLEQGGDLHPLQKSFLALGAAQCGYCTPGMILSSKALLDDTPSPTESDVRRALAGNLCRCTGYVSIIEAVLHASHEV
jgi:aerobic carbon-monoxide dehydrogenase small subunit